MADAKDISFIARSKRRKEILKLLKKVEKLSQPEIMKLSDNYKSHTSRSLKELRDKGIISCLNPKDRKYKFYKITKKGKEVLNETEKIPQDY